MKLYAFFSFLLGSSVLVFGSGDGGTPTAKRPAPKSHSAPAAKKHKTTALPLFGEMSADSVADCMCESGQAVTASPHESIRYVDVLEARYGFRSTDDVRGQKKFDALPEDDIKRSQYGGGILGRLPISSLLSFQEKDAYLVTQLGKAPSDDQATKREQKNNLFRNQAQELSEKIAKALQAKTVDAGDKMDDLFKAERIASKLDIMLKEVMRDLTDTSSIPANVLSRFFVRVAYYGSTGVVPYGFWKMNTNNLAGNPYDRLVASLSSDLKLNFTDQPKSLVLQRVFASDKAPDKITETQLELLNGGFPVFSKGMIYADRFSKSKDKAENVSNKCATSIGFIQPLVYKGRVKTAIKGYLVVNIDFSGYYTKEKPSSSSESDSPEVTEGTVDASE